MYQTRLKTIIDLSFESLFNKIHNGIVIVENEASLQLQLSSILKTLGELYIYSKDEHFSIELEKPVFLNKGIFNKSKTIKAKIDVFITIENSNTKEKSNCAIELKYFKKSNHREPNNRYDVFNDLSNLEKYEEFCNFGVLLIATDHEHYVTKKKYSDNTKDFDFRDGQSYKSGDILEYRTTKPHGKPIALKWNYNFHWKKFGNGINFLKLFINYKEQDK